jgi:hypothetical protein
VPDDREARLVILDPKHPHSAKAEDSPARQEAQTILDQRSAGPRTYRNALVFLAADRTRLEELDHATREYLAWTSIETEREALNLDAFQTRQTETGRQTSDEAIDQRLAETFVWLLAPTQGRPEDGAEPDPLAPVVWEETRLQGSDRLAVRASTRLVKDQLLLTRLGGGLLRHELDRIPLWRGDHVLLNQLAEDFATYPYLPRLKNPDVLAKAVQDGVGLITWREDGFGYAQAFDPERKRYVGLVVGHAMAELPDLSGVVVKAEVAAAQQGADTEEAAKNTREGGGAADTRKADGGTVPAKEGETPPPPAVLRRFYGSVELDATRLGRDASQIAEEVVQHLTGLVGSTVRLTLEIEADIPSGAPDNVVRTVSENCRTLRFKAQGFEKE